MFFHQRVRSGRSRWLRLAYSTAKTISSKVGRRQPIESGRHGVSFLRGRNYFSFGIHLGLHLCSLSPSLPTTTSSFRRHHCLSQTSCCRSKMRLLFSTSHIPRYAANSYCLYIALTPYYSISIPCALLSLMVANFSYALQMKRSLMIGFPISTTPVHSNQLGYVCER